MAITGGANIGLLRLSVDMDDIDRLVQTVLSPAAIKRIQSRAINETTAWIKSRLLRELPSATGIPRKVLARRVRQGKASANMDRIIMGRVWMGIKPIDAMALKDVGAVNSGYMTGDFYFEGGFKAFYKTHTKKMGIYARDPDAAKRMNPSQYGGASGKRLMQPMKRQNIKIDSYFEEVVRRLIPQAERELARRTQRLVSYELERATR